MSSAVDRTLLMERPGRAAVSWDALLVTSWEVLLGVPSALMPVSGTLLKSAAEICCWLLLLLLASECVRLWPARGSGGCPQLRAGEVRMRWGPMPRLTKGSGSWLLPCVLMFSALAEREWTEAVVECG